MTAHQWRVCGINIISNKSDTLIMQTSNVVWPFWQDIRIRVQKKEAKGVGITKLHIDSVFRYFSGRKVHTGQALKPGKGVSTSYEDADRPCESALNGSQSSAQNNLDCCLIYLKQMKPHDHILSDRIRTSVGV
jgi:hypothetical protein